MNDNATMINLPVREAGSGPAILCLHSSISSSRQWQPLIDMLSARYRVVAADLIGYGQSDDWDHRHRLTLTDEAYRLAPLLAELPDRIALAGHSFGAVVALELARLFPDRVAAMALFEPVSFHLLLEEDPSPPAAGEIRSVHRDLVRLIDAGDLAAAAHRFVDYWSGAGAWSNSPDWRRAQFSARITKVLSDFEAVFDSDTTLFDIANIACPVLLMRSGRSPQPTGQIIRMLHTLMPAVEVESFDELGHMGPVTHPDPVNAAIARFFARHFSADTRKSEGLRPTGTA